MAKKLSTRVQEPRPATRQDIDHAIGSLTHCDLLKLKKFAIWRVRALGLNDAQHDAEALLQDAVTAKRMFNIFRCR